MPVRSLRATLHCASSVRLWSHPEKETTLSNQHPAVISQCAIFPFEGTVAVAVSSDVKLQLLSSCFGQGGEQWEMKDVISFKLGPTKVKRNSVLTGVWKEYCWVNWGTSETSLEGFIMEWKSYWQQSKYQHSSVKKNFLLKASWHGRSHAFTGEHCSD